MGAMKSAGRALGLLEEADALRAEARALLEPLYRAQGWRGASDALSVICSGAAIMSKAELPAAHAHRRAALTRIAGEIDAGGREDGRSEEWQI
jgi:hypothetical protein